MTRDNYINPNWSSDRSLWEREPDQERLQRASLLLRTAPVQAVAELRSLSEEGSVLSMIYLGHAFYRGIGTPVDLHESEKWYRRASDRGSAYAAGILGDYYYDTGQYSLAETYFKTSADRNYLPGIFRLGKLYLDGIGVSRRPAQARAYLEKATAGGHVVAKRILGGVLLHGEFGPFERLRGLLLILGALKDSVLVAATEPESDRLRG